MVGKKAKKEERKDEGSELPLIFLNYCGVAPLHGSGARAIASCASAFENWQGPLSVYQDSVIRVRNAAAKLLQVPVNTVAFVQNSAHGLNVIAHGLRLNEGDEILSYRFEYPSNHYPWAIQELRGVRLTTFKGQVNGGRPHLFTVDDVREAITPRTRVLAVSHVQFTSGFTASLEALGEVCRERDIVFVLDAAQSVGVIPVHPSQFGADALVTSGWKWLRGPVGSGFLYVSERLMGELDDIWVGPDMMQQGENYLDHRIQPFSDARRYHFSTLPVFSTVGLAAVLEDHLRQGEDRVLWERLQQRQGHLIERLARLGFGLVRLPEGARAGVLSFNTGKVDPRACVTALGEQNVVCSSRGGYLRFAPHHDTKVDDLDEAVERIERVMG